MSAVRTFFLMYGRNLRQIPRIPVVLVFGIVMPAVQLFLFGSIFQKLSDTPGFTGSYPGVQYYSYIAPALILFTCFIGMANSSAALIVDLRTGYFDKLRTTPAKPWMVIVARLLAESTRVFGQGLIVLLLSFTVGASVRGGVLGGLVMLVLAVFFSACTAGLAVTALAMKTRSDQATQSAFPLFFILLFLSSAFQATGNMPDWVQNVVKWNPVDYIVQALREIMIGTKDAGTNTMTTTWPVDKILAGGGVAIGLAVLLGILNWRVYRTSVANR
ncbi:MAG: ABC transporter permease [Thermoplasmatota archaeon]